ncbi:cell wall-binding repeat-containing protein [Rossellomorea arthrocnemi]
MKRKMKLLFYNFITVLLFAMIMGGQSVSAFSMDRITGADRFNTAVTISKKGWNSGASTVVIANGRAFPDALSGAPLAYHLNGPLLLTESTKVPSVTIKEIRRLNAKNIILLGGKNAVSESVKNTLQGYVKGDVNRIGGKDRFETSLLISKKLPASSKAIVVNGENFPDAIASAPYAAKNGHPILLTKANHLPQFTRQALKNKKSTYVIGGQTVINKQVENLLPSPIRIAGKDRYDTSAEVANKLNIGTKTFITTGMKFSDALTGSILAAKQNGNLLLVEKNYVPYPIKVTIDKNRLTNFTVLGGTGAVKDRVGTELKNPIELLLVNKKRSIPSSYKPTRLVEPNVRFPFSHYDPKRYMDSRAVSSFEALVNAAWAQNVKLYAQSGYRSYSRQSELYNYYKSVYGEAYASQISAKPGHSEHQTGLAMDVTSASVGYDLNENFASTKEGRWVANQAYKYGFIIRYPKGKESITGYAYEPWHLRYVGKEAAQEIYENGITLEQYLAD